MVGPVESSPPIASLPRCSRHDLELTAQLDNDLVGWLTTVTPDGQPQSSVVWFLREGDDLLIYSKPGRDEADQHRANPKVAFNLRGDVVGMQSPRSKRPPRSSIHLPHRIETWRI